MMKRRTYLIHIVCDANRATRPLVAHMAKMIAETYNVEVSAEQCEPAPISAYRPTKEVRIDVRKS